MFKGLMLQGVSQVGFFVNARFGAYAVILAYSFSGGFLAADTAVKLVGYMEVLQIVNTLAAVSLFDYVETRASLKRIQVPSCNILRDITLKYLMVCISVILSSYLVIAGLFRTRRSGS